MKWLFLNTKRRLLYAFSNPRYAVTASLREATWADERLLAHMAGANAWRIRRFLDEPSHTPEFMQHLSTPYSVDNDWWVQQSSRVDRAAARAMWGASPSDPVILFCAKLQPLKRPLNLLRAFAKARVPNALLLFAGEGPLRPQLESEVAALGIGSRVRFLGFVNQFQLPAVYASADLMVLPSEYEPFAVVVNEAMCCGCPVIVSDRVGAGHDLVAPVAPQFIFPCGDVSGLAHILKDAFSDRTRLQSVAAAALAHIQTWSPEHNIAATLDAIRIGLIRVRGSTDKGRALPPAIPKKTSAHPQR